MWNKIKPYVVFVLIALGVGALSALLSKNGMELYQNNAIKPPLSPPNILFPIVWSVLYVLMGISAAIVWTKRDIDPDMAYDGLKAYALQLVMNFFWSIIFFNLRAYLFSFIWLLLLAFIIAVMIYRFFKVSPVAAYIQMISPTYPGEG